MPGNSVVILLCPTVQVAELSSDSVNRSHTALSASSSAASTEYPEFFRKSPIQALQMTPNRMPSLNKTNKFSLVTAMSLHLCLPHLLYFLHSCFPRTTLRSFPFCLWQSCPLHLHSNNTGMLPNQLFPIKVLMTTAIQCIRPPIQCIRECT